MSDDRPDLYRSGNKTSARFDHVRRNIDITVRDDMVYPNTGGISTYSEIQPGWSKNVWMLGGGIPLSPLLQARNDEDTTHWSIEPTEPMTIGSYEKRLGGLNASAVFVPDERIVKNTSWNRLGSPQPGPSSQPMVPQDPCQTAVTQDPCVQTSPSYQTTVTQDPDVQTSPSYQTTVTQDPDDQTSPSYQTAVTQDPYPPTSPSHQTTAFQGPQAITWAYANASVSKARSRQQGGRRSKRT